MSDVAARAGVSITTVSHVVNRTRSVSAATEGAVLAAIADTGYVPDEVLRSMRSLGSNTVGLALSAMSNQYFGDVVHIIEQRLSAAGYSLLLVDTHDDLVTELRAVGDLLTRRVDAIILAPASDALRAAEFAAKEGVPLIVIDRAVAMELDQVVTQSVEPTASLVDHLASLGHRRIAFIAGKRGLPTSEERIEGYVAGVRRNGLRYTKDLIVIGNSTSEGGAAAFDQMLSWSKPATAVVVGNNRMTIGVLRAAQRAKVAIPAEVALACFDDFEWSDLFHPGLTAMSQPTALMGEEAAHMVVSRLKNPSLPPRRVLLGAEFMHRESCGCVAASVEATSTRPRSEGLPNLASR